MGNVLLLLPNRESPRAVREAITAAKTRASGLLIAVVLDPESNERVSAAVTEMGFMGEKVGDTVRETLARAWRTQAEELVRQLTEHARAQGVAAEVFVEQGDPSEICQRLVATRGVDVAILVAERRSWLTRLLAREALHLPHLSGCEVRVIEEE